MTGSDGFGSDLVWLSVLIQRRYAQICADHDLTPVQATLLCAIRDRPQGMGGLARELTMTKTALSGLVDRMERRGLVQREVLQRDRRAITLRPTAAGEVIVGALYADVSERLPDITDALPAKERLQLASSVTRLISSAQLGTIPLQAHRGERSPQSAPASDRARKRA